MYVFCVLFFPFFILNILVQTDIKKNGSIDTAPINKVHIIHIWLNTILNYILSMLGLLVRLKFLILLTWNKMFLNNFIVTLTIILYFYMKVFLTFSMKIIIFISLKFHEKIKWLKFWNDGTPKKNVLARFQESHSRDILHQQRWWRWRCCCCWWWWWSSSLSS